MRFLRSLLSLLSIACLCSTPVGASDWVEDDDMSGFYKHGVRRDDQGYGRQEYRQPPTAPPVRQVPPKSYSLPADEYQKQQGGSFGGATGGFSRSAGGGFGGALSPLTVPNQLPADSSAATQPAKKKGFFGKLGSIGKSLVRVPGEIVSDPNLWYGAGALAGAGANAYMNYQFMRNNPGIYNNNYGLGPYYGGYGMPYGYGMGGFGLPYGGYTGFPYGGFSPYGSIGGLPYYGSFPGGFYTSPRYGFNPGLNPGIYSGGLNPLTVPRFAAER